MSHVEVSLIQLEEGMINNNGEPVDDGIIYEDELEATEINLFSGGGFGGFQNEERDYERRATINLDQFSP